jgi:virulence-associated protein VagC
MTAKSVRLILILTLVMLPVPALAWDMDCRFGAERGGSVDTSGADRVEIVARAGDLTVRPATGPTLSAGGRACASSQAFLDQTLLHVRRQGSVVQVHVQVPDEMKGIGLLYAMLDLSVQVPAGLAVSITDSSGDMTLDGVRVDRVQDSSGDILARRLPADVEIDDSSGDIHVEDAAAAVRVSDSSGDISVRGAQSVHIPRDSSGDISIERVAGDVRIDQDSSGDITVSGIGGNVELLADGSGQVRITDVKGAVQVP